MKFAMRTREESIWKRGASLDDVKRSWASLICHLALFGSIQVARFIVWRAMKRRRVSQRAEQTQGRARRYLHRVGDGADVVPGNQQDKRPIDGLPGRDDNHPLSRPI